MRVMVTGGRSFSDLGEVWGQLDALHALSGPISVIIHGGATGADSLANSWAVYNSVTVEQHNADWSKHGRAAGPIRNGEMIRLGKPDLVVAFPGGTGTANAVRQAKEAGITVIEVDRG